MKKRIAVGLAALLCCALGSISAQEITEESRNLYSTRELKSMVPASQRSKLTIKSASTLQGSLDITTSPEATVKVVYTKKARTTSKSTAIDFIDQIAVNLVRVPGGTKLELRAPNPAPWSQKEMGSVEAALIIPEFCQVDVDAPYFDIVADGPFEAFVVPKSLGRLEVSYVTAELQLVTSNRRVTVENISGLIEVETTNSPLVAQNIKSVGDQAVFRNEGGDIKISEVAGDINVRNSYGRTEIDMFEATGKKSYVRNQNGPIEILVQKVGDGQLIVTNRFEDIELSLPSDISAEFSLAVEEDGKIEVYNFPFKPDLVQRNRLSLVAGEGAALISGSVRGKGNLYVRGYDPED
jgi:hypothetical protein